MELFVIFLSAVFVNNYVLSQFLGICPFVGVSKKLGPSISMGMATTFVMTIAAAVSWLIYYKILIPNNLTFLKIVSFILVIASLVQFVEMFIKKISVFYPKWWNPIRIFLVNIPRQIEKIFKIFICLN